MKKSWGVMVGTLVVASLFVVGCTKNEVTNPGDELAPANVTSEQSARIELAKSDAFVQNDEASISDLDLQPTDYGTFGKIDANITPLWWGRFITSVVRTARDTVYSGDTMAVVHVHKETSGLFRIRARNGAGDTVTIEKPFVDNSDRKVLFKRVARNAARYWLNWLPVASSLVKGGTSDEKITITEIKLKGPSDSVTIADPLAYFLRYRWLRWYNRGERPVPELRGGDPVTIRVTLESASPDTDVVTLRVGASQFHRKRIRMQFVSEQALPNGKYQRQYEYSWFVHFHTGYFHAAVDAITNETLCDDAGPYAMSWWGVPYRVF